jgi:hypothetical protein
MGGLTQLHMNPVCVCGPVFLYKLSYIDSFFKGDACDQLHLCGHQ